MVTLREKVVRCPNNPLHRKFSMLGVIQMSGETDAEGHVVSEGPTSLPPVALGLDETLDGRWRCEECHAVASVQEE